MPNVLIKRLGPYNREANPELICEYCREYRNEEDLDFTTAVFRSLKNEEDIVVATLNICKSCVNGFINNTTLNKIRDTFSIK